ncbi:MAG: hypothetical protein RIA65_03785, partial [Woeseia sp.]
MSDTDQWLERYARNQRDIRFRPAHRLAAGLLVLGLVAMLSALPVPKALYAISPLLNWGSVFLMASLVYYFIISVPLAIGMLPINAAIMAFQFWLGTTDNWQRPFAALMTLTGVACLYLGHYGNCGLTAERCSQGH